MFAFLFAFIFWVFKLTFWCAVISVPFGIAYYFYLKHRSTYFQRLGLPQPPITSIFLGNLEEFERNGKSHEKLLEWHKKYGTTFGILEGAHRVIVTSDLKLINEIYVKQFHTFQSRMIHPSFAVDQVNGYRLNLFFSQGNQWKRLRALFASSLTVAKIKSVDPILNRALGELCEAFEKDQNQVVDVIPNILNMTFAVISRSALGIDEEFGKSEFLQNVVRILGFYETAKNPVSSFFAGTWDFLCITKYLQILQLLTVFRTAGQLFSKIEDTVAQREKESENSGRHRDFLDFLREAQDDNIDTTNTSDLDAKIPKKLTRQDLLGLASNFLFGGADTTATLINYCLYELALHPNFEKEVLDEIESYIGDEENIDYNSVKNLEFLERFVKETARLHPFAFLAAMRRAIEPATLQDSDGNLLKIDEGTAILPNFIVISKDKNIWGNDAEEFNPDRFLRDKSIPENAWLPFGAGPRVCPGKNLAIYEAKAALVCLLKKFKFEICDETETEEITKTFMNFKELKMKIVPRNLNWS